MENKIDAVLTHNNLRKQLKKTLRVTSSVTLSKHALDFARDQATRDNVTLKEYIETLIYNDLNK